MNCEYFYKLESAGARFGLIDFDGQNCIKKRIGHEHIP